jgi:glucose-6-phosphate isomerase
MNYSKLQLWERFQRYYTEYPAIGLALDLSRMRFGDGFFAQMEARIQSAFDEMEALEAGAIANPDEGRMVGHYWLRNPSLAPTAQIRKEIEETLVRIEAFANDVHSGLIQGQGGVFTNLLIIGIGGSALGPQFVANALGHPKSNKLSPFFFDNTDPDGIQRVLATIGDDLGKTLCVVISKSGSTKETKNGMLEAKTAYEGAGLKFGRHSVAITRNESALFEVALKDKWLATFPMWDWVGGRTSELSAVGLLPAALQGFDIQSILSGAKVCDAITRSRDVRVNPSAQLALAWYFAGDGRGSKNMIVIPYKDRLDLLSRYLQQLVMESLGKEYDRAGALVNQGISVFGNKGSTDQHSYIQQLLDGRSDFFVTFLEVLSNGESSSLMVDRNVSTADYLAGFYLGTRQALFDKGRDSITVTVQDVSPSVVGALIALFERSVGFYASLVNINAYDQPGVEAGKKAAEAVLSLQSEIFDLLTSKRDQAMTCSRIAQYIGKPDEVEHVFKICERLFANQEVRLAKQSGSNPFSANYKFD